MASNGYTDQQRAEAVAVALSCASLDLARRVLAEIWSPVLPPSLSSISAWRRDPSVVPDEELLQAIARERKGTVLAGLHRLHQRIGRRFDRDIDTMSWTDIQRGAIALGILTDKLLGTGTGGNATINLNDNRGRDRRSVNFSFGPQTEVPDRRAQLRSCSHDYQLGISRGNRS